MTRTPPQVDPLGRYSICETARLLEVDRHTIQRWAKVGALRVGYRKTKGIRPRPFITGREITRVWTSQY
jgi:predicted site-specific integrase-resolvase